MTSPANQNKTNARSNMAARIAVNFGGVAVTVLPPADNSTENNSSSLYDELLLMFPGGVGEIYHPGEGESLPPTLTATIPVQTPGVAVAEGDMEEAPRIPPVKEFGAEEVYNMLITTLFLLFVLTTVALLIFLLMRRPPCCPCCHDPYDASASAAGSTGSQTANITYLTESHGIVVKKWMKDSPPPYESPPDYSSLSPELIMDAKTLSELVGSGGHSGMAPPPSTATTTPSSQPPRPSSPLCTTPLFSSSFCDSPRSLTPTIHHDAKVYECPPSPIFTHHQYSSPTGVHCHPPSTTTYASSVGAPSPPTYESVPVGRRKDDNQLSRVAD